MIGRRTSATDNSVSVGGDNHGTIINVNAPLSPVGLYRDLPTYLAAIIYQFANASASLLANTPRNDVRPEVEAKLKFNNISRDHRLIRDWTRHVGSLHKSYQGVEQGNQAARYLVKRMEGVVYDDLLLKQCKERNIDQSEMEYFARNNAVELVRAVTEELLNRYINSTNMPVEAEIANLAISLVVVDAVVECEVLARPNDASSS